MKVALLLGGAIFAAGLSAQVVSIPSNSEPVQQDVCAKEPHPSNLTLLVDAQLSGVVLDPSGGVLPAGYVVQLRDFTSKAVLKTAVLQNQGRFELGSVPHGKYRFIVVQMKNGVATRFGFEQPVQLMCKATNVCNLRVILPVGGTDRLENFCSPQ